MEVKREIKKSSYYKLIEYASEKCDVISLTRYYNQHKKETDRVLKCLFENHLIDKEDVFVNHSEKRLNKIYKKLKKSSFIFDKNYKMKYEINEEHLSKKAFKEMIDYNRRDTIKFNIYNYIYEKKTTEWNIKYQKNIIYTKKSLFPKFDKDQESQDYAKIYFYKITDELKKELKSKKSLYQWGYPETLDNLSFFKNGKCWLKSVSHERLCTIYCDDENEYNYLKSLGIKFLGKNYQYIDKEDLNYDFFDA